MVKPRYMLNVFNVFNTVLRMMLARGWRFASGKGGKSRAGHKGGKGDTGLHLPPSLPPPLLLLLRPKPALLCLLAAKQAKTDHGLAPRNLSRRSATAQVRCARTLLCAICARTIR